MIEFENNTTNNNADNYNVDSLLQQLVAITNSYKDENISVTLFVNGIIISGNICDAAEYSKNIIGKPITNVDDNLTPLFIHLKNIQIFTQNNIPIPTYLGTYWRGKLSSVDGFSLGKLIMKY